MSDPIVGSRADYDLSNMPIVLGENGVLHLAATTGTTEITAIVWCHQRTVSLLG